MSLDYLKKVFAATENMNNITVQLLRITNGKEGTIYYARQVEIQPEEELTNYIKSISDNYKKGLEVFETVDEYKGDYVKGNIYKLLTENSLIKDNYQKLDSVVVDPSKEGEIKAKDFQALLVKGTIEIDNEEKVVMLISMKSPVTTLKNKFSLCENDIFKKDNSPSLTLNNNFDSIIINETFYMLTIQAENLFNMERSYKKLCNAKVEEILTFDIFTDSESFKDIATKGLNPKKFVSFNQSKLDALKDKNIRKRLMKLLEIKMKGDKIVTDEQVSSERLIKFLCDKAMIDPIDKEPREVSAAKKWS